MLPSEYMTASTNSAEYTATVTQTQDKSSGVTFRDVLPDFIAGVITSFILCIYIFWMITRD